VRPRENPGHSAAIANELTCTCAAVGRPARGARGRAAEQGLPTSDAAKPEARLLTASELKLVAVTRSPEIERQSVAELKAAARR